MAMTPTASSKHRVPANQRRQRRASKGCNERLDEFEEGEAANSIGGDCPEDQIKREAFVLPPRWIASVVKARHELNSEDAPRNYPETGRAPDGYDLYLP